MPASDKTKPHLIYRIRCVDGRSYVGATTAPLHRRWNEHSSLLRRKKHSNHALQEAWNALGPGSFTMSVLQVVSGVRANESELHWIKRTRSFAPSGFNVGDPTNLGSHCCKAFVVTSPDGESRRITNLNQFCRKHGLGDSHMTLVAQGKRSHHRGWTCRYASTSASGWRASRSARARTGKIHQGAYDVTTPSGRVLRVTRLAPWSGQRGLDPSAMCRVAQRKASHHRGYRVDYVEAV